MSRNHHHHHAPESDRSLLIAIFLNGLLTLAADDNIIRLTPPLIISKNEVNLAIEIIRKVLNRIK